jgi:methyl-accepting chemotaxis protein
MRMNLPVTTHEAFLNEGETIVSKTDLKGRITYINQTFLDVSGFTAEDVMGKAHNIVRHPDMPPAAFEDLWNTLKSGCPWSGMVKNRCKNGDFYWVRAEVSPVLENGAVTGYLSVRFAPKRAEVDAAAQLYQRMRDGSANNVAIIGGAVVKAGRLAKAWRAVAGLSFKGRIVALIIFMSLLVGAVGALGLNGLLDAREGLRAVYEERTLPLTQIGEIRNRLLQNRLLIATSLVTPTPEQIKSSTAQVSENIAQISKIWEAFAARTMRPDEKKLADQFAQERARFVQEGLLPTVAALQAGNSESARGIVIEKLRPLYEPVDASIRSLTQMQVDLSRQEYEASGARFVKLRNESIAAIALGMLCAVVLGFLLVRSMVRSLGRATRIAESVAQGDLNINVTHSPADESGRLIDAMRVMVQALKGFEAAQAEMLKLHNAGQTSKRIASHQFPGAFGRIAGQVNELAESYITLNSSVVEVVKRYANGDLSVDVARLPGEKAQITEAIDGVKSSLTAVNAQIQTLADAASRGDFKVRGDETRFEHEFAKMVAGLNQLMQTSDAGLADVSRVLEAVAKGNLTEKMTADYQGAFGKLKQDCNQTVENLTDIVNQIKDASETIDTAAREISQGNTDLSQRTEEQASSLEETASSMEQLTSTVKQNADNARQANQLAVGASGVAVKGGDVVRQVVTTMSGISESSKKIADIIGVIDGIAFQTNILALNAAVEAARAGEQGRGFAVVATEVRNLAQRSANAAKEIKELITDSVSRVDTGTQLVDEAGKTMDEIVTSVKRVTDIMAEITAASQEQSSGIEQVNQAITQMDEVTQQNAALVEEAAAAAESLQEQSGNLVQTVGNFKLAIAAGTASERRAPDRAKNVARLPAKPAASTPARKSASNTPSLKKAVGADDDWQEF